MSTTPFMLLDLPVVSVTLGPEWATELNAALDEVDAHDHTSNKGKRIVSSALNIDDGIDMQLTSLENTHSVKFEDLDNTQTGAANSPSAYVYGGDLWYTNLAGVPVQITAGGTVVTTPASVQVLEYVSVNADTTIGAGASPVIYGVDCSSARDITLPLAGAVTAGRIYIIKDATGESEVNALTLSAAGSDLIDGASTQVLESDYGAIFVASDGSSNWLIL